MAMNCDSPAILQRHLKDVHDFHHVRKGCRSHIFPRLIKNVDPVLKKVLGNVGEADIRNNAIPAIRMLHKTSFTYPGYCKLRIVFIPIYLNFLYNPNSFISLSDGRCIARIVSIIQFE